MLTGHEELDLVIEDLRRELTYAQAEALFFHRWIEREYGKAVRIAASLAWDRKNHAEREEDTHE